MISSRNSPALRTPRSNLQNHKEDTDQTPNHVEEPKKASAGWVPILFDDGKPSLGVPRKHKGKASMKPHTIHVKGGEGEEKPEGDGVFFESIDRPASRTHGASSSVGGGKPNIRMDSFNGRISDYISRAKLKFLTMVPSFGENRNAASFFEGSNGKQKTDK